VSSYYSVCIQMLMENILRYKWRAVSCTEEHSYICALRRPNCPRGYTFRITISNQGGTNGDSCYKVKGPKFDDAAALVDSNHHVSTLDDMCRVDGTRLAVPGSTNQMINILRWLSAEEPSWMTGAAIVATVSKRIQQCMYRTSKSQTKKVCLCMKNSI
jgi:hypothetical protein